MSDEYMENVGRQIVLEMFAELNLPEEPDKASSEQARDVYLLHGLLNLMMLANQLGVDKERFKLILDVVSKSYHKVRSSAEEVMNRTAQHNRN